MSEIAKLYDEVMAGQATEIEKTAAADVNTDNGPQFDAAFFTKVAEGDEESVSVINQFIEEARAEGHGDEEIEAALGEAMQAAGYDGEQLPASEPEVDEFEAAKMSSYAEGSEQALKDALESELAKTAGITAQDLMEYELGGYYGAGYAETRAQVGEAMAKIAENKIGLADKARKAGGRLWELLKGGKKAGGGVISRRAGNMPGHYLHPTTGRGIEAYKSLAARTGAAAPVAVGATVAGKKLLKKDDNK